MRAARSPAFHPPKVFPALDTVLKRRVAARHIEWIVPRDARPPAGERTQAARRLAGSPPTTAGVADTGGTPAGPVAAASGLGAASAVPAVAAPRAAVHGAPAVALPGAAGQLLAEAKGMAATSEQPAAAPASGAASAAANAAANMLERKRRAEAIATGWPALPGGEQPQTAVVVPALEELMAQFESLAHAGLPASAGTEWSLAHTTSHELALVSLLSVISAPLPASAGASQPRAAHGDDSGSALTISPAAPSEALSDDVAKAPFASLNRVKRTSAGASSPLAASPTLGGSPSPVAAGGGIGQVPPAAALIVLAAACVLATRLLGRLAMDPLAWRSALLSLRLERPG